MKRRVVITGIGTVNPLGNNIQSTFQNLKLGSNGIIDLCNEVYYNDLPKYYKIGAPIRKDFNKEAFKTIGSDNLLTQISISAADEAIVDSGLKEVFLKKEINPFKVGIITGTSAPSLNCIVNSSKKAFENKDFNFIDRMGMLKILTNLINFNISCKYNIKGISSALSLSCASGLNAIGEGMKLIQSGESDVVICGSSEGSLGPYVIHSMNKLGTLYKNIPNDSKDSPRDTQKPFDVNRQGIVLGEGSGMFVLESYDQAIERKAKIYAEVSGFSTNGDSYHLTKPKENGEGAFLSMSQALLMSNIKPENVDLISAHATSTSAGDISEITALKTLFGLKDFSNNGLSSFFKDNYHSNYNNFSSNYNECTTKNISNDLSNISIIASKTQIGHLLGAAGSVELIISLLCMENNLVFDNYNTKNPIDKSFNFRYNKKEWFSEKSINTLLKNSFAFGGVNSSLVLSKIKH